MKTMKINRLILAFIALALMLAGAPAVIQAAPLEGVATGGARNLHNLKIPFKARPAPVVGRTDDDPDCYTLNLYHTGDGDNPTADLPSSGGCGTGQYIVGTTITLTAAPASGWRVKSWNNTDDDAAAGTNNSVIIVMGTAARTVTVNYEAICYTLALNHTGNGDDPTASPPSSGGCGADQYIVGTTITLTAAPAPGWQVASWTGTDSSDSNIVTMPAADRDVTVNYEAICYTLALNHTGNGDDPTASPDRSAGCSKGKYHVDQTINLTAAPAPGWQVASWTGTDSGTNVVTMPAADRDVTVNYEAICYTLTLAHTPVEGGGDPTASPTSSGGCGTGQYIVGTTITLTAAPAPGWQVASWTGTNSGTNVVTMPADNHTVTVNYKAICYTLTLSRTGNGNVPTASPDRTTGCSKGKYHVNQTINLTAAPAWMWHVDSWNGTDNNSSTSNNNTATMPPSNHTVTVNYKATPPTCYTLLRSYTGEGKAPAASPAKSAGCPTGQYVIGELITLTAEPAAGWRVTEWKGTNDDSSTATTNTLFMQNNSHVTITYSPVCYTLTLGHLGQGGDPVASPDKSEKCSDPGQYIVGTSISLFASPAPGWYIERWIGTDDDENSATQNNVTMPANNRVVTVIYTATPPTCYTLALSFTGQGGPPTAEPANSPGCNTGQYTAGQVIALTAWPDNGWRVKAWSGTDDDSSVALTNSVTMPADNRTASVAYEVMPDIYSVFMPIVMR